MNYILDNCLKAQYIFLLLEKRVVKNFIKLYIVKKSILVRGRKFISQKKWFFKNSTQEKVRREKKVHNENIIIKITNYIFSKKKKKSDINENKFTKNREIHSANETDKKMNEV